MPVTDLVRPPSPRRADAERNRARVLAAAEELFAARGVHSVTMDDVARAAGVGKGTLYRGFGDKSGLALALLDDRVRDLQQALLDGPAPLGPGAPPAERLGAFVEAYLLFQLENLDLVLMSETAAGPGSRLTKGSYGFWSQHLTLVLEACGARDARLRAEVLLGALAAEQLRHWLAVGRTPEELRGGLTRLAQDLV